MVKKVTEIDVALVELLKSGVTGAPRSVLDHLEIKGQIEVVRDAPRLTPRGRKRAEKLAPFEATLRGMHATRSNGESAIRTVGSTIHG